MRRFYSLRGKDTISQFCVRKVHACRGSGREPPLPASAAAVTRDIRLTLYLGVGFIVRMLGVMKNMRNPESLTIGKVATQGGVKVQTIRYYERRGLLPKPARTQSGYRKYSDDAIRRLRFIRQAQALGFSLSEIEELLSLRMRPGTTCGDIKQRARQKIATVNGKIEELQRIKDALGRLARACHGEGPTSECPILEALERERNER